MDRSETAAAAAAAAAVLPFSRRDQDHLSLTHTHTHEQAHKRVHIRKRFEDKSCGDSVNKQVSAVVLCDRLKRAMLSMRYKWPRWPTRILCSSHLWPIRKTCSLFNIHHDACTLQTLGCCKHLTSTHVPHNKTKQTEVRKGTEIAQFLDWTNFCETLLLCPVVAFGSSKLPRVCVCVCIAWTTMLMLARRLLVCCPSAREQARGCAIRLHLCMRALRQLVPSDNARRFEDPTTSSRGTRSVCV